MSINFDCVRELLKATPADHGKIHALMVTIGSVILQLQSFEDALALYIVGALRLQPGAAAEEVEAALNETRRDTMGQLIARLRRHANVSADAERLLNETCRERNWLVHRLWHGSADDVFHDDRFAALLKRINEIGERANHLKFEFARLLWEHAAKLGISQEEIEAATSARLHEIVTGKAAQA